MLPNELTGAARWLVPLLVFAGVVALGLVLRSVLFRSISRWAKTTASQIDDFILVATRWPSYLWIAITAAILALHLVDLPGDQFDTAARRTLEVLLVLSITVAVARFVGDMVGYRRTDPATDVGVASTGLQRTVVRVAVYVIGCLVVLGTLGINIAPLLGALGVGGLAAGLALQPTLSNLFAGFQISVTKQVRIGNRVRLASGEEGYVTDISWRTTTLRTPNNHLVIIPNSRFADSIVTNFNLPDPTVNMVIPVSVAYTSDTRRVEAILNDEAKKMAAESQFVVDDVAPVVRFLAFGESGLQFTVTFRVPDFESQYQIWNELYHRIFERLRRENIEIPFPSRTVYMRGDALPPA